MTNLVPQSMREWMRTMERKYQDLATRRVAVSAANVVTPRWRSTLTGTTTTVSGTHQFLGFSVVDSAPEHDVGDPAFLEFQSVSGDPRYVAAQEGLYLVRVAIHWNASAGTGSRKLHIIKDGSTTPLYTTEDAPVATFGNFQDCVGVVGLQAGGYFRIGAYQSSGANLDILAGSAPVSTSGGRAQSSLMVIPVGAYTV